MSRRWSAPAPVRWVGLVLSWSVMVSIGAALVAALIVPRLVGATPYVIQTGSMRPGMPPGTLVVAKPATADQIGIGDVITYQLESGEPTVVTHRVIAEGIDATGQPRWRTQGDANEVADRDWVLPVQVKGERWYSIPYLGYAASFVTGQQRQVLTVLVALGLIGYAGSMYRGAFRERRRNGVLPPEEHAPQAERTESPVDASR